MADRKISDLTALTTPASGDYLPIVDISEASAANKNKRITIEELLRGAPDGTAGAPGIAFESDPNTGIYSPGADALGLVTGGTERARIDSSGRLLVGTSTAFDTANTGTNWLVGFEKPSGYTALSIKTNEASSNGAYLNLGKSRGATANSKTIVNNNDELGGVYFEGADGAAMLVGARVAAFVDGTPGANDLPTRLVFSTTADGASSPTERMRINNQGNSSSFAEGGWDNYVASNSSAAGTSVSFYNGRHSAIGTFTGTNSYYVWTNGDVQNTNGSYTAISDAKLKENIVDAGSQWNDLKAIRIRNWNFKAETGHETHRQIGPIAQELETVCPGLVFATPDRDEDGNETGDVTKGVNQSVLYMKAVKALQEAMERIELLEARLDAANL